MRPGVIGYGARPFTDRTLDALLATQPDLAVEHTETCLRAGVSFAPLSLGAVTDPQPVARIQVAAASGSARLIRPTSAVVGIDQIEDLSPEAEVRMALTGTMPARAWHGAAAERAVDLSTLSGPTVFFSGPARKAASRFPKSTNVAVALALAWPGLENLSVTLVADPSAVANRPACTVSSASCQASFTVGAALQREIRAPH